MNLWSFVSSFRLISEFWLNNNYIVLLTGNEFCLDIECFLTESTLGTSSGATATVCGMGSKRWGASWNETSHCNSHAAGCLLLANFWRRLLATASADSCEDCLASVEESFSKCTRVAMDVQKSSLYSWSFSSVGLISSQSGLSSSSLSHADSKKGDKSWLENWECDRTMTSIHSAKRTGLLCNINYTWGVFFQPWNNMGLLHST